MTLSLSYSYGETVNGAFHCRFGVREEGADGREGGKAQTVFIRGLEETGSVRAGMAGEAFKALYLATVAGVILKSFASYTGEGWEGGGQCPE